MSAFEAKDGIESSLTPYQGAVLPLNYKAIMENSNKKHHYSGKFLQKTLKINVIMENFGGQDRIRTDNRLITSELF